MQLNFEYVPLNNMLKTCSCFKGDKMVLINFNTSWICVIVLLGILLTGGSIIQSGDLFLQ